MNVLMAYLVRPQKGGYKGVVELEVPEALHTPLMADTPLLQRQVTQFALAVYAMRVSVPVIVLIRRFADRMAMDVQTAEVHSALAIRRNALNKPELYEVVRTRPVAGLLFYEGLAPARHMWPRVWVHGDDLGTFYTTGGYAHEAPHSREKPDYTVRPLRRGTAGEIQHGWVCMPLNVYVSVIPKDAAQELPKYKHLGKWGQIAADLAAMLPTENYTFQYASTVRNVEPREVPKRALEHRERRKHILVQAMSIADILNSPRSTLLVKRLKQLLKQAEQGNLK